MQFLIVLLLEQSYFLSPFLFPFNFTYRYLLKMPYFLPPFGVFFLAKQFLRNHENAQKWSLVSLQILLVTELAPRNGTDFDKTRGRISPVSSRRDVLTGEKIGATRRICSAPRICRFLPGGDLLARLHSRSQFAGTLDADDVSATGIHYWHSLPMIRYYQYRYFIKLA